MEKNNWCVYKHTCPNGKGYIGITGVGVDKRWGYDGRGYYGQVFYKAIKKYGWDNIKHEVLVDNISEEKAKELEKYYIEKYNTFYNGYNFTIGGEGTCGVIYTEERRRKLSKSLKGRKISDRCIEVHKAKCKPVYQIDLYTKQIIAKYDSAQNACDKLGFKRKENIINCANGRYKTAYKYIWRYVESYDPNEKYDLSFVHNNIIYQIDKESREIIQKFNYFADAEKLTGIKATNIYEVCKKNGRQQTAGGYIWCYADEKGEEYGKDA